MSSDLPTPDDSKRNRFAEAPITSGVQRSVPVENVSIPEDQPVPSLGRLHPLSLGFDVLSHIRSLVVPAVIAVFSAANGSIGGLALAGFIFIPTLIHSTVRYFSLRYQIKDAELVVTEGIIFQRNRTVPVGRIQNINLIQTVLHRIFGVAEVRIETASGTEPEATLRVLSMAKVERLRNSIFDQRNQTASTTFLANQGLTSESTPTDQLTILNQEQEPEANQILTIPLSLLARAGLASNKGSLLIGVLIGAYVQFDEQMIAMIENLKERFNSIEELEGTIRSFGEGATTLSLILVVTTAVLLIFLFFRLLGMAWYLLRFSGYRLSRSGDDFRISCGLFTKVSASVPRKRIQFISIHRNLFMRWMKLASIRIETAGGAGAGHEDATKTISSRWFIPVIREEEVSRLIAELRPGLAWKESAYDWQPLSPRAANRLSRIALFTSTLISAAGLYFFWPWGWVAGLIAAPFLVGLAIKRSRSRKYARAGNVVIYRSGVFTTKTSFTFFDRIQTVSVTASPFDRRWGMATLCVDTAAAGPADHRIRIRFLTQQFAEQEFDAIVHEAADKLPVFS